MPEDIASLNFNFLAIARELARSHREEAITRLGLDAATCELLGAMSMQDVQELARRGSLVFRLAQSSEQLSANLSLARRNPMLSEAHLLLSGATA